MREGHGGPSLGRRLLLIIQLRGAIAAVTSISGCDNCTFSADLRRCGAGGLSLLYAYHASTPRNVIVAMIIVWSTQRGRTLREGAFR